MGGRSIAAARRLRKNATQPERTLWRELRQLKNKGFHFRRQVPVGPYFADFICHGAKLVVEVDGHLHGTETAGTHDDVRTQFLNAEGYRVMRVTNGDVVTNIEGVMEQIFRYLAATEFVAPPTLNPSPPGGGEQG